MEVRVTIAIRMGEEETGEKERSKHLIALAVSKTVYDLGSENSAIRLLASRSSIEPGV